MEASRLHDHDAQEDSYHADRRETIRADLERRLGKICANFSEADFRSLVEVMTEQKLRGERKTQ
jgi:hypothetical protein